ncbi:MAG: hypothetical protein IT184_06325 [Acidobacteria bacterium]|nr:hypothetical protein [Acidobacteriota bacterium]
MTDRSTPEQGSAVDVGEYCRALEAHLTRVNDGQIIRIVGPAFELARGWAREGIPLSIVCHGIDRKAERHNAGQARRALRLEFCEADVIATYERWRRAIGLRRSSLPSTNEPVADDDAAEPERRSGSVTRQLDRAMDRLSRVAGRLDRSEAFREAVTGVCQDLSTLREAVRGSRGAARAALLARLPAIDEAVLAAARAEVGEESVRALGELAAGELAPFRGRLTPAAWDQSVAISTSRLLRDQLDLPTIHEP